MPRGQCTTPVASIRTDSTTQRATARHANAGGSGLDRESPGVDFGSSMLIGGSSRPTGDDVVLPRQPDDVVTD
jgi:hypothetical protein